MFDIFIMDMGGHDNNVQDLVERFPHARVVRYYDNHLDTVKRCISRCRTPFAWIISSCCDYSTFDFDYRAVPWEAYQIHCWASGNQQFGDTFLVPVAEFKRQQAVELLEWYKDINWHSDGVNRLAWPRVIYTSNNLIDIVKAVTFDTPYLVIVPEFHQDTDIDYDVNLWREKTRNLHSFSSGNSLVLVPKDIKRHLKTQMYDYPYITTHNTVKDPQQDIIFIMYDEAQASANWQALQNRFPDAKILAGVKGMDAALQRAAQMSRTDWYYAVFAKTQVHPDFKFDHSPDYFQEPKHYIFYSHNQANGLEYGYAGIVMYNVELVNTVKEFGIDYTMSAPHAVVPEISAIAYIGATPYQAWRSAFRECYKLNKIYEETGCVETHYRLSVWTSQAQGPNSEWILAGARDGVEFYKQNQGNELELKKAFDWTWLKQKFQSLYTKQPID